MTEQGQGQGQEEEEEVEVEVEGEMCDVVVSLITRYRERKEENFFLF